MIEALKLLLLKEGFEEIAEEVFFGSNEVGVLKEQVEVVSLISEPLADNLLHKVFQFSRILVELALARVILPVDLITAKVSLN